MCGIMGVWGSPDDPAVRQMMRRQRHRGPDADGVFDDARGTLGHTRLAIMDVAGGDQPIRDPASGRAIVANGEIYNFARLRAGLTPRRAFRTRSDSEPILYLYEHIGRGVPARLDGMFAFAIADGNDLFVARDPVGIKPLYYGRRGSAWAFASELKALVGLVDEVREFPPGCCYHTARGFRRYRELPDRQPVKRPVEDHARRVRAALEKAVVKRLMADVPVGAFLSGGLDSSVIAAIARQHVDELHTFSVGIEGSRDLAAARLVARHIDSVHHELAFTIDEAIERLPGIVHALESFDRDLVRSAVPCAFVSRLAAQHVKVILTGEGADELFAGYTYYRDWRNTHALHRELNRSIHGLHNVNLQRVDRLTMAHSIEGRVPFLDLEMIETAQTVPVELKLYDAGASGGSGGGRKIEKWILRKACEDLLPREIVWRDKEQFDEGSGTADTLGAATARFMSEREAAGYLERHPEAHLRCREEAAYHKLLCEAYDSSATVLDNVARWAQRPRGVLIKELEAKRRAGVRPGGLGCAPDQGCAIGAIRAGRLSGGPVGGGVTSRRAMRRRSGRRWRRRPGRRRVGWTRRRRATATSSARMLVWASAGARARRRGPP